MLGRKNVIVANHVILYRGISFTVYVKQH